MKEPGDLVAMVGSRICHDLISPLGAIGNGVELLSMTGMAETPEMALIAESIAAAQARVLFFRVAYGAAEPGARMGRAEIASTLGAAARGGRLSYFWEPDGDVPRAEVKAIFLLFQCFETAMPLGGDIRLRATATGWEAVAESDRLRIDDNLWTAMLNPRLRPQVGPAQVQFALLPAALAAMNRALAIKLGPDRIVATF